MIEVFPEPRRRCAAYDLSSVRLINPDFVAKLIFISIERGSFPAFHRVAQIVM
jgi:hypothetical protein